MLDLAMFRVVRGGDPVRIVRSEVMRGRDGEDARLAVESLVEMLEAHAEKINRLDMDRKTSNDLAREMKRIIVDLKQRPPEDMTARKKALDAQVKVMGKRLETEKKMIEEKAREIGNLIDFGFYDSGSDWTLDPYLDEHAKAPERRSSSLQPRKDQTVFHRYLETSLGLPLEFGSLRSLTNRWLNESEELPRVIISEEGGDEYLFWVLSKGDKTWSDAAFDGMIRITLDWVPQGKIVKVSPCELGADTSKAVIVLDSQGQYVGFVGCSTDYVTRELEIRSGQRQMIQEWKKYVHVVQVRWDCSAFKPGKAGKVLDLKPTNGESPAVVLSRSDIEEIIVRGRIENFQDLIVLDSYFCSYSYADGYFFTSKDLHLFDALHRTSLQFPPVQYPYLFRWYMHIKALRKRQELRPN